MPRTLNGLACPGLRLRFGKDMTINKRTLRILGEPRYIHIWWGESQRVILLAGAPEKTQYSFSVSAYCYTYFGKLRINTVGFIKAIMRVTNWRSDSVYMVCGEYIPELDMVAFKLDSAVITAPEPEPAPGHETGEESDA